MSEHRPSTPDLLAEVVSIASAPMPIAARAEALIDSLHPLLRYDAAWIGLLDPGRRAEPPLARRGYPDRIQRYLHSLTYVEDLELAGLRGHRGPTRMGDLPMPAADLPLCADYLHPAGFREGIGVALTTPDGRYLGTLAASTESCTPVSDAVCAQLAIVAPLIAQAVDPMRTLTELAGLVTDAIAGVALAGSGRPFALPGLPSHRLLAAGSRVLDEAAACLTAGDQHVAFLTVHRERTGADRYLKATLLACPRGPAEHPNAVLLLSPPRDLHQLTHHDLQLLGMLLANWSRPRITAALGLPRHTVITALEDIRTKLGAPTREAAVLRAADQGLHLPPRLARRRH